MKTTESPVVVTKTFRSDPHRIWSAITDHQKMLEWYFDQIPDFRPEEGFRTAFEVKTEERTFTHEWEVTEVIPEEKICYTWKYKEYRGNSELCMELLRVAGGTLLTVTHRTTEDFPEDIPEFRRESCLAGWKFFILERLNNFLGSS